jgi:hypothetical protein
MRLITGGKITMFKLGYPVFLLWRMVMHVPLMFLSEWRDFSLALALQGKKT